MNNHKITEISATQALTGAASLVLWHLYGADL